MRMRKLFILLSVTFTLPGSLWIHGAHASERPLPEQVQELMATMNIRPITGRVKAPDFTLSSLDRSNVHLKSRTGKVIMLSFWATW